MRAHTVFGRRRLAPLVLHLRLGAPAALSLARQRRPVCPRPTPEGARAPAAAQQVGLTATRSARPRLLRRPVSAAETTEAGRQDTSALCTRLFKEVCQNVRRRTAWGMNLSVAVNLSKR